MGRAPTQMPAGASGDVVRTCVTQLLARSLAPFAADQQHELAAKQMDHAERKPEPPTSGVGNISGSCQAVLAVSIDVGPSLHDWTQKALAKKRANVLGNRQRAYSYCSSWWWFLAEFADFQSMARDASGNRWHYFLCLGQRRLAYGTIDSQLLRAMANYRV